MKNIKSLILVALVLSAVSCAAFKPAVSGDDALGVVESLNNGNSELLIESTSLPFVFDSEILESDTQIRTLWNGLVSAGYIIDNPVIVQQRPVTAADGNLFSESWEISTFFKRLLGEDDLFIQIDGSSRRIYMVLRPGEKGSTLIKAWKGETK